VGDDVATTYKTIYDLALTQIKDYKLDDLYTLSPTNFAIYLNGFLMKAIPRFDNCIKDLSDRNETTKQFNETLDDDEIDILSEYMVVAWMTSEINDVRQITAMMLDKQQSHRYSEANLLDKKTALRNMTLETLDTRKTAYGLKHNDWEAWSNGDFGI
jgi:hypothetical protein